jgi:hypothetical protein
LNAFLTLRVAAPLLIAGPALIFISGCGQTAHITRGPQTTAPATSLQPVDGIPFYVKRAYCQQQASWLEPQFTLEVTATVDGKHNSSLSTVSMLSRSQFLTNDAVRRLQSVSGQEFAVQTADGCSGYLSVAGAMGVLRNIKMNTVDDANLQNAIIAGDVLLTSNTAQIVPYVDYETVYYYNTARPVTGTSSVDVKLNADGTLSEGNSSVTDQTLSTITGVLSTAITSFAPTAVSSRGPGGALPAECRDFPGKTVRYDVSHSVAVFRHTHTFKTPGTNELACVARPANTNATCGDGCSLEITAVPVPDGDKKSDDDKKPGDDKPPGDKPPGTKPPSNKPPAKP